MARGNSIRHVRLALSLVFMLAGLFVTGVCACGVAFAAGSTSRPTIGPGARGEVVKELQRKLKALGFDAGRADGHFGTATERAVREFQQAFKLTVDGVVGLNTWSRLEKELQVSRGGRPAIPAGTREDTAGEVELVSWSTVNRLYTGIATVIDIETGLRFKVRRRGGHYHADSEPLTKEDTVILKRIYGGGWSWDRRAVILEVGSRRIAASMNGMPHGNDEIQGNGFDGHFCIHFLGSRIHSSGRVDPEHQRMVRLAARIGKHY